MENQDKKELNPSDPKKWLKLGFFSGDEYLVFAFKKTERITAALYLVSGILKDSEPIKWELREKGIILLSTSLSLNSLEPREKGALIQNLFSTAVETSTLLNIAAMSGVISSMNRDILCREIESVVSMLQDKVTEDTNRAGYVLSESFFNTSDQDRSQVSIGQSIRHDIGHSDESRNSLMKANQAPTIDSKDRKSDRQKAMLELLEKRSPLTIKDFTKVITDCSEKTVQRELLDLVEKGSIIKEGERRWSRYSIKK